MRRNDGEILLAPRALAGIVRATGLGPNLFPGAVKSKSNWGKQVGSLGGKVALITGAGQGVGQGIFYALASEGAKIALDGGQAYLG
jgi:hypothetical protein